MDQVRAYIHEHDLLGPSFDDALAEMADDFALDFATPVPLSEMDRSLDFWDERKVKEWGIWEERKWEEKLEMTSEQVEMVKRLRSKLLVKGDEEEGLDMRGWKLPWTADEDEVIFSREAQQAVTPVTFDTGDNFGTIARQLFASCLSVKTPEDDAEMKALAEVPDINTALDLKLEGTPDQLAFIREFARSNKERRAPSPPIFARPPLPDSPLAFDLRKALEPSEDNPLPPVPSSPTGQGVSMTEWNKQEYIFHLPSSSTLPPSDGPIWSSPAPPCLGADALVGDLEQFKREPPLFPRSPAASDVIPENGGWTSPLLSRGAVPTFSADEDQEDELAGDDTLDADLKLIGSTSLASILASDDTVASDLKIHSLTLDARMKPPKLPSHIPSPSPSPPLPSSFASTSGSSWALKAVPEPHALSIDLGTRYHHGELDRLSDVLDDSDTEEILRLRDGARRARDRLKDSGEEVESLVKPLWGGGSAAGGVTEQDEGEDEVLESRNSSAELSQPSREETTEHFAEGEQARARAASAQATEGALVPRGDVDQAAPSSIVRPAIEEEARRTPSPPFGSPPPPRGHLTAPGRLETAPSPTGLLLLSDGDSEPVFVYPESEGAAPAGIEEADEREEDPPAEGATGQGGGEDLPTAPEGEQGYVERGVVLEQWSPARLATEDDRDELPRHGSEVAQDRADSVSSNTTNTIIVPRHASPRRVPAGVQEVPLEEHWSSADALSRFLQARGRPSNSTDADIMGAPSKSPPPLPTKLKAPPTPHSSPPPDSIPFSVPTFLTSPVVPLDDAPQHRIVAFQHLLQKRSHYQALQSCGIQLVDRPSRCPPRPHEIHDPHLILDGSTCVLFHTLNKLPRNVFRLEELQSTSDPSTRDQALFTTLARLSARFDRILLLLEETETTPLPSSTSRLKPYAYTPPVLAALRELADALEQHGREGVAVEMVLSKSPTHSASITKKLLDHLRAEHMADSETPVWDERQWLGDDPTEDEVALLRLFDLHELSAAWILDRCDLATFLGLTAEERELAFGPVVGSDRLKRVSAAIASQHAAFEAPSSPRSFADISNDAQDTLPQDDMLAESFDWVAYEAQQF